jgi:16S rRNA (adenine1518-N6/adenine1519-N6)-dimethyltransferase
MVQEEVGERVTAGPGKFSILGISVQIFAQAEIAATVSKNSFWPAPEVDSAILKITPRPLPAEIRDQQLFFRIVKIAFAGKRKQIHNTLAAGLKLPPEKIAQYLVFAQIDPGARAQELGIPQWIALYRAIEDDSAAQGSQVQ